MNLFILSWNVKKCARWHFDKHVVKMILELAQLLSTAHWTLDDKTRVTFFKWKEHGLIYRPTHKNHPCAIWVRQHVNNYKFTCALALALCDEYYFRYGCEKNRQHASRKIIEHLTKNIPKNFPDCQERLIGFWKVTQPAQAMPDDYKVLKKPLHAYHNYYRSEQKSHLANWKKREEPTWFQK